jgi:hypothetical protein
MEHTDSLHYAISGITPLRLAQIGIGALKGKVDRGEPCKGLTAERVARLCGARLRLGSNGQAPNAGEEADSEGQGGDEEGGEGQGQEMAAFASVGLAARTKYGIFGSI